MFPHLKYVLSNHTLKDLTRLIGQIVGNVPIVIYLLWIRLLDSAVVVVVFEQEDGPVLARAKLDEGKQVVFHHGFDDKVDICLSFFKGSLFSL